MKNNKLLLWSLTVALCGLLFGLDTAVISGADKTIEKLWDLSKLMHGTAMAMALYGTVFGALFGGLFADLLGRKRVLFWVGLGFFISSIGSAVAQDVYTFMAFRFWGGLCIGVSSVVAPLYISEIAPAKTRGFLVALFQFNIVFGIMIAYISNYLFENAGGADAWRWMLGVVGIPSLIFTVLTLLISESPRWLALVKGDTAAAKAVLDEIDPETASNTLQSILDSKNIGTSKSSAASFFSSKYNLPILLTFLLAFFNQLSGINAVIYYAPRIFEKTGLGASAALFATTGIGIVNLIFTMAGVSLIDKFGRRVLMYIGSIGYIVSLALMALCFYNNSFANFPIFVFMFIAAHAIGQGAVIWVFFSEIFPNEIRASGQAFGCFVHWIFAAIITQIFPTFEARFGGGIIFLFFSVMMIFQLLYVRFMMPETKGVALEDMQTRFH
jgi:SP family arabinose:H+ symporter-like MFS transporter